MQPLGATRNHFEPLWLQEVSTPIAGTTIAEADRVTTRSVLSENPRGLRPNDLLRLTNSDHYVDMASHCPSDPRQK